LPPGSKRCPSGTNAGLRLSKNFTVFQCDNEYSEDGPLLALWFATARAVESNAMSWKGFDRSAFRGALVGALGIGLTAAVDVPAATATSRIKDLANVEGVRENQLIGYGLVVGLAGTGDTINNSPFTRQSITAMLERLGVNIRGQNLNLKNIAAVMVTANLPAFSTQGTRIDVTVSALGDAKNLQGGTLLVTPLLGADGNVYAVAQGSLAISGFQAEGDAARITRGVPTVGRIANGAIIEREIDFGLNRLTQIRLALRNAVPYGAPARLKPVAATGDKVRAQAQDFESMFISSMMQHMFTGIGNDGPLGNGPSTGPWRSLLTDQYAKSIVKAGGLGLAKPNRKSTRDRGRSVAGRSVSFAGCLR
jgi:hypothetical protein